MALKVTGAGGGPTPTIDVSGLATDAELATHAADTSSVHGITDTTDVATTTALNAHSADTTSVHGITDTTALVTTSGLATHTADTTAVHGIADTSVLATTTVTDALDSRVDTLESSISASVVREWINVLNYSGVDATGATDSATGLQNAFTAAKANIGGRTQGTVFIPKGRYKSLASLNAEGIILQGEGNEASQIQFPTDLGTGTFAVNFQLTQSATKKYCGPRDLQIQGPNTNSGLGAYPANMDGVRLGNAGLIRGCDIRGFRAQLNLFKDHENIEHCNITGGIGVMFDKTQSGGDQIFTEVTFSGCLVCAVGIHPDSNIGGANFIKCHMGFCPVSVLKFDVQGAGVGHLGNTAPGMYDVTFSATTSNGSSSITGVTGVTTGPGWGSASAIANGMRVVGTGIPAGAKVASYDSGAGTFTIQDAGTGSAVNAIASGTVTMYAGVMQVEAMAACTFTGCSFESYGNALMYNQPLGIKGERVAFRDCLCSNSMDSSTRVAGWPATAPMNNVAIRGWEFQNSAALIVTPGSASTFYVGAGDTDIGANLGDIFSPLDAVNAAGVKLITYQSGVSPNFSGARFSYSSGSQGAAIGGDITQVGGTVAVGDLLCLSGSQSVRHTGTGQTAGVAMQAGVVNDRVPRATSGAVAINVDASNSAMFAASNKWVKPDTAHAGYVVEAVNGTGTGTVASGATTAVITHSLGATPLAEEITILPTASVTNDPGNWWVSSIGATTFTVNVRSDPGSGGFAFAWRARSREIIGKTLAAQSSSKVSTRLTLG